MKPSIVLVPVPRLFFAKFPVQTSLVLLIPNCTHNRMITYKSIRKIQLNYINGKYTNGMQC